MSTECDGRCKELELRASEAESNMMKAAEYGQQLISQLADVRKSKEQADQEIYQLKNRLELCLSVKKAAAEDVESLKDANAKLMNDKDISDLHWSAKVTKLQEENKAKQLDWEDNISRLEEELELRAQQLAEAQDRLNRSETLSELSALTAGTAGKNVVGSYIRRFG